MTDHHGNQNNNRSRRISIAAARKMLGLISRNYSDKDIAEILDCLYGFAEEAFDAYQCGEHGDDQIDPDAGSSANEA